MCFLVLVEALRPLSATVGTTVSENRPSNSSNARCRVAELRALCRDTGRF